MMRRPALGFLLLLLSACGLHPLYGGGSSGQVAGLLRNVEVAGISGQQGWLVRTKLVDRLGETGSGPAQYRLDVALDDNITSYGLRADRAATQERRTLRARYQLVDLANGAVVLDETAGSDASIDVVSSDYATVAAEQTALGIFGNRRRPDRFPASRLRRADDAPAVKANKGTIGRALDQADPKIRFYLFCGPDEAQSRALGARLLEGLGATKSVLASAAVKSNPALLVDEAAALSLFGERRLIWIEPATNDIAEAVETLLGAEAVESAAVAIAGSLTKTSPLLKLSEASPRALAFTAYMPEGDEAARMVGDLGRRVGLKIRSSVGARIAEACGNDQAIVAQELEKLALYNGASPHSPKDLEEEAIDAVGVDSSEGDFLRLADLALLGEVSQIAEEVARMPAAGSEAIPAIRSLQRRLLTLAPARARIERGERLDAVMASFGRSLFWKDKDRVQAMLKRWTADDLATIAERAGALERNLMFTEMPIREALGEELLAIARKARSAS